ncbi:hypothetical protein GX48_04758 [Paracoccidioides brasiliensis]|nr:hypothetical protein GX48_04758 [Paracoccidioides brasiliensis]
MFTNRIGDGKLSVASSNEGMARRRTDAQAERTSYSGECLGRGYFYPRQQQQQQQQQQHQQQQHQQRHSGAVQQRSASAKVLDVRDRMITLKCLRRVSTAQSSQGRSALDYSPLLSRYRGGRGYTGAGAGIQYYALYLAGSKGNDDTAWRQGLEADPSHSATPYFRGTTNKLI